MKTFKHLALLAAFFATLAAAPLWAGRQRLADEDLAALQTKGLAAEDHLKLAAHFLAEAEAFEREAESHEAMAKRYNLPTKIGSLRSGMAQHCVTLSRTLRKAANEARQLEEGHQTMADQAAKPTALAAVPLWAGPQRLADEELAALQTKGLTPEDHLKLADHFLAEAEAFDQQAKSHEAMATRYNLPAKVGSLKTGMALHCVNLSRTLQQAAKEASQLAEGHKTMADQAAK